MISLVLKDKINGDVNRVEMSFKEFFENYSPFKELSLDEAREHFNYSVTDTDPLILSLNAQDFTINFSNLLVRNIFNLVYEFPEGKNIFDIYTSFNFVGFKKILEELKIGESKKFDYCMFLDDKLIHYYIITIYRSQDSILFSSIKNISYEMFTRKDSYLNSSDEGVLVIRGNSIVFANSIIEELFSISQDELFKLSFNEVLDSLDIEGNFKKSIEDISKGYSISQSFTSKIWVKGVIKDFEAFCSSFMYESLPSIHIRIMDKTDLNLAKKINFQKQNELQMLRSFANIASFVQDDLTNEIRWSPEAVSVLGMRPTSVSLKEDLFKYIIPEDKTSFEKTWINSIIHKMDVITEFSIKNTNGELKHLYLFAKLFYSPDGKINKIRGFIQDISQIFNYKTKYELSKNFKSNNLKTSYHSGDVLAKLILNLIKKEYKLTNDSLEVLEKTQNRLKAVQFVYKMLSRSARFQISLKTFFDKYIKSIHKFYDINHIDLDWEISREFVGSRLVFILAFSINEILAEILKHTSPQVIETIKINLLKEEDYLHLVVWTDLIFYDKYLIEKEFVILKYILKSYDINNYNIEVNDEGTLFDIKVM